jgi:hypothetical protein
MQNFQKMRITWSRIWFDAHKPSKSDHTERKKGNWFGGLTRLPLSIWYTKSETMRKYITPRQSFQEEITVFSCVNADESNRRSILGFSSSKQSFELPLSTRARRRRASTLLDRNQVYSTGVCKLNVEAAFYHDHLSGWWLFANRMPLVEKEVPIPLRFQPLSTAAPPSIELQYAWLDAARRDLVCSTR